jgi:hypothetical protein
VSHASIVAADDFSYPDAPFTGQNGGTGIWLTPWVGFGYVVNGGKLDGTQSLPTNFNEVSRFIDRGFGSSPPPATPLLFVAFDLSTPASIGLDDFAGVRLTFGVNGNILTFGKLAGSNEFLVGAGGFVSTGITVQPNTTYHLLGGYEVGTDLLSLWIDPGAADFYTPGGGTNSADAIKIQPGTGHANVVYLDTSRPGYIFDNLVLSDTAEGVGLNQQAVPELGSFLIWSILAVVLSGGSLAKRRSHSAICP